MAKNDGSATTMSYIIVVFITIVIATYIGSLNVSEYLKYLFITPVAIGGLLWIVHISSNSNDD
jgi:hypothetical protein